jgi:formylglycine-generating enzyme required for sulfatase activity
VFDRRIKMKPFNIFKSLIGMCMLTLLLSSQTWANENLRCSGNDCAGKVSKYTNSPKDMVLVPSGSFLMGIDKVVNVDTKKMSKRQQLRYAVSREAFHDEGPAHNVILDAFHIKSSETSNKKYSGREHWRFGSSRRCFWSAC